MSADEGAMRLALDQAQNALLVGEVPVGAVLVRDTETGRQVVLTDDLQRGFALNQPLSTFALAAFELLDPESPTYALDLLSIIEATLDDPRGVLMAQQFKARGEAVAEMKMDGIEYDERMELLEEVTWPKPLEELLLAALEEHYGSLEGCVVDPDRAVTALRRIQNELERVKDLL